MKIYLFCFYILLCLNGLFAQEEDLFKQFRQLLPRGGIPAIINPTYVIATEADISDNTWILGIEIDGQARAYSLNLLNHHEIVNDAINKTVFAAVW